MLLAQAWKFEREPGAETGWKDKFHPLYEATPSRERENGYFTYCKGTKVESQTK